MTVCVNDSGRTAQAGSRSEDAIEGRIVFLYQCGSECLPNVERLRIVPYEKVPQLLVVFASAFLYWEQLWLVPAASRGE
jgi:hypothetical protein